MENNPPHHEFPKTQCSTPSNHNHNKSVKSNHSERKSIDGGYGWIIVFVSLMTSFLTNGISSSIGVLFVDFLQYFGSNKATTSFVGSLFLSVPLILGPFSGYCINKWGCRMTCIIGSVISGLALSAAFFARSLMHLLICFSVAGIGQSFCLLSSIVIIPLHFHHKLSLASGLSVCGEGIGSFVFPPLVGHLLETFAWRGTLLILGGLVLNIAVFGSLMRNPVDVSKRIDVDAQRSSSEMSYTYNSHSAEANDGISAVKSEDSNLNNVKRTLINGKVIGKAKCYKHGELKVRKRVCLRRSHLFCFATVLNFKKRQESFPSSEQSSFEVSEYQRESKKSGFDLMKTAFSELIQNPSYGFFCLSNAFLYACGDVPNIYLPDYVNGFGIEMEMASFLLSIAGALNTVGVILMGYLGDLPKINPAILYGCSVCISGISIACLPLTKIYAVIAICMAFYGAAISVVSALDVVLLIGLIPEEDFTTAYSLLLLVQGLATLFGTPLAGFITDQTQSYDLPFYGTGALIAISGLIVISLMKFWSKPALIHIPQQQEQNSLHQCI